MTMSCGHTRHISQHRLDLRGSLRHYKATRGREWYHLQALYIDEAPCKLLELYETFNALPRSLQCNVYTMFKDRSKQWRSDCSGVGKLPQGRRMVVVSDYNNRTFGTG